MLVQIVDAQGASHIVAWQGQDQINDFSGTLGAGAVNNPVPQQVAPANILRAGFLFQNISPNAMMFFEAGNAASGWLVQPGDIFPPYSTYPIPTGVIYVAGTLGNIGPGPSLLGDAFTYREWQNAPGE
jgi:hypothetical protein